MSVELDQAMAAVNALGAKIDAKDRRVDEVVVAHNSSAHELIEHRGRIEAHDERIEALEAGKDRPPAPGGTGSRGYKVLHTANGPIYELPSHVKMADVRELQPQRAPEVSLSRWLAAHVAGERCGDREAVEFARERKQLTTGTSGVLLPIEYQSQWIDLLRAQSVLNRAGMKTVTMNAKTVTWSAVTGDPTAAWHSEAGNIDPGNPTFVAKSLTAQTLACRCQSSMELAADSPDFGSQLAQVMTKRMAAELDRCGLEGSGAAPQPRGIKNTSGRSSQTNVGALTDYSKFITGIGTLLAANCDLAQISKFAVMSPGSWAALENLVTGISGDKRQLPRPQSIEEMEFLVTSNVAGNASSSPQVKTTITLGNFTDLVLGLRLESAIEILKLTSYATNLELEYIGYLRADYVVQRPASFHTIEGVIA